jgi:hypothetical protein
MEQRQRGRPKGSKNKHTKSQKARAAAAALADQGITPLEVMVGTMRSLWAEAEQTDDLGLVREIQLKAAVVAKDCAPYMHPRLAAIEHSGGLELTHEEALSELEGSTLGS